MYLSEVYLKFYHFFFHFFYLFIYLFLYLKKSIHKLKKNEVFCYRDLMTASRTWLGISKFLKYLLCIIFYIWIILPSFIVIFKLDATNFIFPKSRISDHIYTRNIYVIIYYYKRLANSPFLRSANKPLYVLSVFSTPYS